MLKNSTQPSDDQWTVHYSGIKFYENAIQLLERQPQREDIVYVWKVQLPDFSLRNLMGGTYFGRRRWFVTNVYNTTADTRDLLRPIAPGYIEQEWEKWKEPQPWLTLLAQWTPEFLQKQLAQPLASLQLLVDLADHVRTRNLLPLDERSRTTTALLTSAELLLKWPIHYLTLLNHEREHPLKEVRPQAELLWNQSKIRMEYLIRYATNSLPTSNLAHELRNELLKQLTLVHSEKFTTPNLLLTANETQQYKKPRWMAVAPMATTPQERHESAQREKSAEERLLEKMSVRCKQDRR